MNDGSFTEVLLDRNVSAILTEKFDELIELVPEFETADKALLLYRIKTVGKSPPDLALRCALLLCDIGRADCHACSADGIDTYYGYAERSRIYAVRIMSRFGVGKDVIDKTERLIVAAPELAHMSESDFAALEKGSELQKLLYLFNRANIRAKSE